MDAPESIQIYFGSKEKYIDFVKTIVKNNIRKIVFVSKKSKETFNNIVDKEYIIKNNIKTFNIKNHIDGENIISKSNEFKEIENDTKYEQLKEIIREHNKNGNIIFLNVGRHSKEKNLITLVKVFNNIIKNSEKKEKENENENQKTKEDEYGDNILEKKIYLLMVGAGKETKELVKYVEENKLTDRIIFLGNKKNPYPYFKMADYVILTSLNEGYPVVFQEAMILDKKIITTDVSDAVIDIKEQQRGYIISFDEKNMRNEIIEILKKEEQQENGIKLKKYNYIEENNINNDKIYKDILELVKE